MEDEIEYLSPWLTLRLMKTGGHIYALISDPAGNCVHKTGFFQDKGQVSRFFDVCKETLELMQHELEWRRENEAWTEEELGS